MAIVYAPDYLGLEEEVYNKIVVCMMGIKPSAIWAICVLASVCYSAVGMMMIVNYCSFRVIITLCM